MQKNWGTAHDTEVRPERKLHARGSKGLSGDSPQRAAKWRSSAARKNGFQYTATVQGVYGGNNWLWWPGFLVPVIDEHFELAGDLLIVDVKFHKKWEGGETTEVALTLPDAYTTEPGGKKSASRSGKYGTGSVKPDTYPKTDGPDVADKEGPKT
jgi:prophage tail gpP-like protein